MDPAASLNHGLMTHHFWLWGQSAGSKRPCGTQHWSDSGLLVWNYSQVPPYQELLWQIRCLVFPQLGV